MNVAQLLQSLKDDITIIENSFKLKSYDDIGAVYKFLKIMSEEQHITNRKEIFIVLDSSESQLALSDRTCVEYYYIEPAY